MCNMDYDRTWTNETDGQEFYGVDNEDGTTTWYDEDGCLDSVTDTPTDEEQDMNDTMY